MKYLNILTLFAAGSALASSCHKDYECCTNCQVITTDDEGSWGSLNGEWCFIDEKKCGELLNTCKFEKYGYSCCSHCDVYYTDEMGQWGVENNYWCGIPDSCNAEPTEPTNNSPSENFFDNELYVHQRYAKQVESSLTDLSEDLQAKGRNVEKVATAVWLAWDGAPGEVEGHLKNAGDKTIVFILYMIPTRDCNSKASAGGASNLKKYQGYVDSIAGTISKHPESKVVMVIEPDTLGNLITGETEECKTVHTLHKDALAYAVNVFGNMSNVSAYLDAAHGKWLGWAADKTAAVIKEILDNAPEGNIRGFSTNVSNYQPIESEYEYHEKLNAALEQLGVTGKKFIVDTGRSGVDVTETFAVNQTWCNFIYAGLGEPSRGSPDPEKFPLLDAYFWLKPPGEADGSDTGSRADPVCGREDSFPGSPDAGSWFSEYFVSMLEKSPFYGETSTTEEPTETSAPSEPTGSSLAPTENFFDNELYVHQRYAKQVESSLTDLSEELQAKGRNVEKVPTAVWLAWDGAPGEVEGHLKNAGDKTIVFILYMIPTRDCNSKASAGGASNLKKYQGYVDSIAGTISKHPESKVVMVIEPDTLGNLITGETEECKTVHTLHKDALAYAINVFGNMSNVSAYLDAAHGKWLSWAADKTAAVIKEILDNAPNGNLRGFSTNVSNYQPIESEYEYHEKLNAALEDLGITGKKFIVDTGRSGVDVTEEFNLNQTWCNLIYAGLGEPSRGSPDPEKFPLLDAYFWLKPPGEADGSDTGSRADPVCGREDSFPGSPDAGSWFSEYFVSMLEKSPFYGETSTTEEPTETSAPSEPTGSSLAPTENFFDNELYVHQRYAKQVESSLTDLSEELQAKGRNVEKVPTAVWLAWDGAPGEVEGHLKNAGDKTIVFILYMIPTRDCNSKASAGGASNLKKYQGYVDSIAGTISKHPESKVVMVIEPDTLGNLITGETEECKTVHTLHKDALAYAINVFGNMSNVSAYLDAAHGKWLGWAADKTAAVIKEILDNAPEGNIRGFSTNVSNYQPIESEYEYHEKLNAALEQLGVTGKKFIVDTGRSGVDVTETFAVNQTWCNFIYAGLGEPSRGSPDPEKFPLLDAYFWLKPPGEADGSDTGSRADPVCGREDSFPGSPDAGSWFSEYFVSMLENSPFYSENVEPEEPQNEEPACSQKFLDQGYPCCSKCGTVYYVDDAGNWSVENNDWCGLPEDC